MRTDTGSSVTEKVPPKPQHSSGRDGLTNSMPFTPSSKVRGFENGAPGNLRNRRFLQMPQRAATVMQADAMRKLGPRKFARADHVMQKFDEFIGVGADLPDFIGLLERGQMLAHVMDATRRRPDDVVVAGEVARKHALGAGCLGLRAAVGHRLAAAGLLLRIVDLDAEAFEQFERGDPHFGIERVDEARDKQGDFHKLIEKKSGGR